MTEAAGRWKFKHGPQLAPGPDFGHACSMAMGYEEWMSCLQPFASTGVRPSEAGNRPAPRQKKWPVDRPHFLVVYHVVFVDFIFPRYACDSHVIRLMRERTLGNSPTRLAKQLKENQWEEWLNRSAHYMEECVAFANCPSLFPVTPQEPPEPIEVLTSKWLLSVYGKDIMSCLNHVKASITSKFGNILKLDSTRKIIKKLSGHAQGAAQWLSSVGNERGEVLISVLTAQEGPGLDSTVSGLISWYQLAGVAPPVLLYVDRDCCTEKGQSKLQTRFKEWPNLNIRLDIWYLMRRLACTTDAHPLYPVLMAPLSACIFEWERAKREQLEEEGLLSITSTIVSRRISKYELALYCRRRTCGVETTVRAIEHLLQELREENGRDLMGVPLLDTMKMEKIWHIQNRHVKCIQDMPGVSLHRNRHHHQGKDWAYKVQVCKGVYIAGVFLLPPSNVHSRELIGVEYLLAQTGQPLQRVDPDADETDQLLEEGNLDDQEDEGFEEDLSEDPTMVPLENPVDSYSQN
ncbi:hypothetical protein QTP86_010602 [Hemibagrus guttatus]|nr:hypothetical protein QTP86_010602 [Hemibagrus guttatus]